MRGAGWAPAATALGSSNEAVGAPGLRHLALSSAEVGDTPEGREDNAQSLGCGE